jgi:dTMP kinase
MRLPGIVAIEGCDAAGKATQAKLLADYLDQQAQIESMAEGHASAVSKTCLRLSFPAYNTPYGKLIYSQLRRAWAPQWSTEDPDPDLRAHVLQAMMLANKFELADQIERANITEGRNVVLDRYVISGLAYGMADGLSLELLERLHARLPKAHHVLIDIPVEESFKRRPVRDDAYESDRDRLSRARSNYLHVFEKYGVDTSYWGERYALADRPGGGRYGDQDYRTAPSGYAIVNGIGTVEKVHERIKRALEI